MSPHPLDSVSFILPREAPHAFAENLAHLLDAGIPLPVKRGEASGEDVQGEMILAGILSLFAYDPHHKNADYYRRLLFSARPEIKQELSEAAILKARNDDFDLAEEICLALNGLAPEDGLCALNYGMVLDRKGEFYRQSGLHEDADACDEEALRFYRKAMDQDIPDAHFSAGAFFLRNRDFSQAKDCFEAYIALAQGAVADERTAEKIERAGECVNLIREQNLDDRCFKTAYNLIASGQEEKGINAIRGFLESHGDVWNAWFLLGWGLRLLGRYGDGRQAFLQALKCQGGETADTYNELAICAMELGLYAESEANLLKALSLDCDGAKIMSNMGVLKLKTQKPEEAKQWFRSALEYNPQDSIAKAALAGLE